MQRDSVSSLQDNSLVEEQKPPEVRNSDSNVN